MSDFDEDGSVPFIENTSTSYDGHVTKKSGKNKTIESDQMVKAPETSTGSVPILLSKYFEQYASHVHPYTQAFVSAGYRDILKTKEEWDITLTGAL